MYGVFVLNKQKNGDIFLSDQFGYFLDPDSEDAKGIMSGIKNKKSKKIVSAHNKMMNCRNGYCEHSNGHGLGVFECPMFKTLYPNEYLELLEKRNELSTIQKESSSKEKPGFVYLLKSMNLYKIGRTVDIKSRINSYSTQNPHGIEVLFCAEVGDCQGVEAALLKKYKHKKHKGEWHTLTKAEISDIISVIKKSGTV